MQSRIYANAKGPNGEKLFKFFYEGEIDDDPVLLLVDFQLIKDMRENEVYWAIYNMDTPMGCLLYYSEPQIVTLGINVFKLKKFILK